MRGARSSRAGTVQTLVAAGVVALAGCSDGDPNGPGGSGSPFGSLTCSIPQSQIFDGGPGKDGIPALTDPAMTGVGGAGTGYLRDSDRVVGIQLEGQAIAIPLNIFWWHEVVNLSVGHRELAVTHCPLTGSSLAFDRSVIEGAELGVSGLLYMNNLIMYDRNTDESLWPQMLRGARCGPQDGTQLPMVPIVESTWEGWRTLHPGTRVVSSNTGHDRDYTVYPYGDYDDPDNPQLLFPIPKFDTSRPPKERVLGIPADDGGLGFPFGLLEDAGRSAAIHAHASGTDVVVFWDALRATAMAYQASVDGEPLTFSVESEVIVDQETGTRWRVDGLAIEGQLAGTRLEPVPEAFISYWFAWRAFYPSAQTWSGS